MKQRIHYSELGIPVLFLALTAWYLADSYKASATTENLLLILPASIVTILLCLWILGKALLIGLRRQEDDAEESSGKKAKEKSVSVVGAMIILAGYILLMDKIGFDVATFLFIAALMFLQGERRLLWLGGFSAIFAFLVAIFFEYMIPYPMPMLIGKEVIERLL